MNVSTSTALSAQREQGDTYLMQWPRDLYRRIRKLDPYTSFLLLAAPVAVVELLKLAAVYICGTGHWVSGSIVMVCAYAFSIFLVERLFKIVKPKLLTLWWFAAIWVWFVAIRTRTLRWFRMIWILGRKTVCADAR